MLAQTSEVTSLIGNLVRDTLSKPYASQRAKVSVSQSLLKIAEGIDSDSSRTRETEREHGRIFDKALRGGAKHLVGSDRADFDRFQKERRDMNDTTGGAYPASTNAFFVPLSFESDVWQMMKQTDALFDPDVVTFLRSPTGNPLSWPLLDDTSSSATIVSQGQQQTQSEPQTIAQLSFPIAPEWASGIWKTSMALLADGGVNIQDLFAKTAAVRFRRGIGKSLVSSLLSAASLGAVAVGSSGNDGVGAFNTVGTDDLHNLLASVDEEYLASPKCRWLMNFKTYQTLLQVKDRQGHPILKEMYNANGEPILLGRPIAICPSMPSMSTTVSSPQLAVTPIAIGDLSRFIVRVAGPMRILRLAERFADMFQVGFEAFARVDCGLALTANSDSPIKYISTAA